MSHSIPVISLWGQLLVPLQGDISDQQMVDLSTTVLLRIANRQGGGGLIIDASGVWLVDSHLCAAVARLANAARLMGVPTVVCGLSGDIVLTLQAMGLELGSVVTSLGLDEALSELGISVRVNPRSADRSQI
ncbi:MAG TPA: STAS domain-containing protein [Polyangiaceae bacterium]|nr:STAS domain-containing protein [Polyangiaceae bacterium]